MREIYLLGVGHNTIIQMELAERCGYTIAGLYHFNDDRTGETDHGYPIIGSFGDLLVDDDLSDRSFCLTMGNNKKRVEMAGQIRKRGGIIPRLIHPRAEISRFSEVADGVTVGPFSLVQAESVVENDTMILSGVNISHNCVIGEGCLISGGAYIGAYTKVHDSVTIGLGAIIISQKTQSIGSGAIIGAGAVVTGPVADHSIVFGVPAREKKNHI